MSYLLDTNICIYIINARPPHVLERFRQVSIGDIGISSITAAELVFGVIKSGSERNRRALEMFFVPLELYPFDATAVWHYGEIRSDLEQRGEPIGPVDTMIAAHAKALNAVLVTNNSREFSRVQGLNIENWAE
ncbi:MAG: type II toxin-antitoxin system VapC family toxin [Chlorobiaceae bacterium]|nr:type II toxin-antitoxin system VapC family toxin [Chlorobiaceae bacterium]NTV15842.1 type II toxin-antitoxin system VapC family toxin [Chlorobiaceae bacterium]